MDFDAMSKAVQRAQGDTVTHSHNDGVSVDLPDIMEWLASKRTTLWSTWAIDDVKGREQAAQWFYKEMMSLMIHASEAHHHTIAG